MKEKHTNFTTNQLRIRNRIIQEAKYMIENHASCHETAKHIQTNAETVRVDLTKRFVKFVLADKSLQGLYVGAKTVIQEHRSEEIIFPEKVLYFIAREIISGKTKQQVIDELPVFFQEEKISGKSHISIDVLDKQIERIKTLTDGNPLYEAVKNQLYINSDPQIIIPPVILTPMLNDYLNHKSLRRLELDYHYTREVILKNFKMTFPEMDETIDEIKKSHTPHH